MTKEKVNAIQQFADNIVKALDEYEEGDKFPWVKSWSTMDTRYRNGFFQKER
jgi:antirestriction protein ArdC